MVRSTNNASDQRWSALEHACRGVVGDRLRSVSVDTPDHSETLYRRSDLKPGTDRPVLEAMAAGASCESPVLADGGSPSPPARVDGCRSAAPATDGPDTICAYDNGYVTRIRIGDASVVATMDGIKMDRESELSAAVRGVIGE